MTAKLPDIKTLIDAGINPKTGLPYKFGPDACELKNRVLTLLRIIDQQDAVTRFKWFNLPDGIDGELIERILYYKGQLMFFYLESQQKFYALPYSLSGGIDVYGRYNRVKPLPFYGSTESKEYKTIKDLLNNITREPVYSIKLDEVTMQDWTDKCVLLHDYSKQISQTTMPRQMLNDPLLTVMAECIPYMRTSMILGTGVKGMRVNDADQQDQVYVAAKSMENAALTGQPWIPITGQIEFQEISDPANLKGADYMQAMESLDNFRLGTYGIENGGLFQKKAHMLETEQAMSGGSTGLVFQNSLAIRQKFCDILNSIWGLGVWVEPSESVIGGDTNGDGLGYDIEDPMTSGGEIEGGNENDSDV